MESLKNYYTTTAIKTTCLKAIIIQSIVVYYALKEGCADQAEMMMLLSREFAAEMVGETTAISNCRSELHQTS